MDLDKASEKATKLGTVRRTEFKKSVSRLGTIVAVVILIIGVTIWLWNWATEPKILTTTSASSTYAAVDSPSQVVYAQNGLVIPVGLEWGAPITIPGDACVFWDGPPGLEYETSPDGGRTWGNFSRSNQAHFRSPVAGRVTFFVQHPPPPGETCKRRY
jgi:hypothetical protein